MSVLKQGILTSVEPPKYKKIKYTCELWSTKVIDFKGQGKSSNLRKCIHLARCSQIELDNYSSEKFFIKHSDGFTDDLIAESEGDRAEWIQCICEVCGLINPLRNAAIGAPKKSKTKTLPPLPPPKPMSEEKIRWEENNMYEEISGDEDDEYSALEENIPAPEGGVLKYDYADMDRGVRPMSYHQDEYGGSGGSATGTSGSGAFQSNESGSDDDEYIEPLNVPSQAIHQAHGSQYYNANTLDGRNLGHMKQNEMKAATLPHRTSSYREKPARKPDSSTLSTSGGANCQSELMNMLSRRKKHLESSTTDEEVFINEESTNVSQKLSSKPAYQSGSTGGTANDNERKHKTSVGFSPGGQQRTPQQNFFNKSHNIGVTGPPPPPEKPNKPNSRPELPIQDPPWLKKKNASVQDDDDRFSKPCPLPPSPDPPWLKKKSPSVDDGRLNKPLPVTPSQNPSWSRNKPVSVDDDRLNKPLPVTPSQNPSWSRNKPVSVDDDRLNKPLPVPPSKNPPWSNKISYASIDTDKQNKPLPASPTQNPSWAKKKVPYAAIQTDDDDKKVNKPLPSTPTQNPSWSKKKTLYPTVQTIDNDDRLNKPLPLPPSQDDPPWSKKRTPSDQTDGDSRFNKQLPPTPPNKTGKVNDRWFNQQSDDGPPPPPPPERGSSKKDETPPRAPYKGRQPPQTVGKKPVPPVKPKSQSMFSDDDDDFPTADEYKRSQAFANTSSLATHSSHPPSLPPRAPPTSQQWNPIDDRPPLPPPKQSTGYHYR